MQTLVTGGAGFIGSHLCEFLLDKGEEVVCVDNLFTGSKRNIQHLITHPRFEFVRHDIAFPLFVEVKQIYNLACPASPVHYQHNPVKTIKMGTVAMVNMLGLAKRTHARILQASTSEVYGDPEEHPQKETYWGKVNPIGPRSCYDEGKRVAEALMIAYNSQNGVDIRIARIFNTYGPRVAKNDGRVISNFIVQALHGKDLTVYGDGLQTRSFCYVDDLVLGLYKLMNETGHQGPVNLGNPHESTILEIAKLVVELTRSKSRITTHPLPEDDPVRRKPDIALAKSLFPWEPQVPLRDGLIKTIAYFRELQEEEDSHPCSSP